MKSVVVLKTVYIWNGWVNKMLLKDMALLNGIGKLNGLESIRGTKEKITFLRKNNDDAAFRTLLYYTLHPLMTYNLSKRTLNKWMKEPKVNHHFVDFISVCEYCNSKKGLTHEEINQITSWIREQPAGTHDVIIEILSKKKKIGVTAKTVNQAFGENFIPIWEIMQSFQYEKYPLKPDNTKPFIIQKKMNGVRCSYYNGELYARSGEKYYGLDHIIKDIKATFPRNMFLDGELVLNTVEQMDEDEAFRISTGIINSDAETKTEIKYVVFDGMPLWDFDNDSSQTYFKRYDYLMSFADKCGMYLDILPALYHGRDEKAVDEWLEYAVYHGYEGIMVKFDKPYEKKRTRNQLKVKRFYTMDLPIIGIEEGEGKLASTMGNLIVQFDNNQVKVGSGFDDEERDYFWNHFDEVKGKLIEVKYKVVSEDKNGVKSLQFPVYKGLRRDKNDISYD